MSEHIHREYVEGCFRCDISRAESECLRDLDDDAREFNVDIVPMWGEET